MKLFTRNVVAVAVTAFCLAPLTAFAQQPKSPSVAVAASNLESRVQRLERLIENQILSEMLDRLEQMQRETRELRGELESHNHRIEGLKRRQRELYIDVDRRLHTIERGNVVQAPAVPAASTPASDSSSASQVQGAAILAPRTEPPIRVGTGPAKKPAGPSIVKPGKANASTAVPARPAVASADRAVQKADYEKAFNLLREGRYEQAGSAFEGYLAKHQGSDYAANAQYWLGEVFYLRRDFDQALVEFNKVVKDHTDSPKRANALLKIGFVHYEKGAWKEARAALESVVRDYKGHSASRLAANRLNQMSQEGR